MEMQLNEREVSLVDAFRRLPPDAASELSALAGRLAELAPTRKIDWSYSWSDEDLNEFQGRIAAAARRGGIRGPGLRPGDVVVGVLVGAQETKVRPAVVIASAIYLAERPDVLVGILTTKLLNAPGTTDYVLLD